LTIVNCQLSILIHQCYEPIFFEQMKDSKEQNTIERVREHLANERTFLAWIRTSIALMGFGFVIVKFSLFLKQISLMMETKTIPTKGYSAIIGIVMVVIGLLIALLAFLQFKRIEKQLNSNYYTSSSRITIFVTTIILVGGIVLIWYLVSSIEFV